jgi:hypothetical protein
LLLAAQATTAAAESAWSLNRGGYVFNNYFLLASTHETYDEDGNKVTYPDDGEWSEFSSYSQIQYGIRDRLGCIVQVPIRSLKYEETGSPRERNIGFGDMALALRYGASTEGIVGALQADGIIPMGYDQAHGEPSMGHGRWQYGAQALAGRTIPSIRSYLQVRGGYRVVTGGRADLLLAGAEFGSWVARSVRLTAEWRWNDHTRDGDYENEFGGRLSALYRLSHKVQLEAGAAHVFGGQNVEAGTGYFLGISVRGNSLGKYDGPLSSTLEEPVPE